MTQTRQPLRGPCESFLSWSVLASRVKERFGASVRSILFCFRHLPRNGTNIPRTITSTANAIKSHRVPRRAGAGVAVGAASGVVTVSDELTVAAGGVAATSGVLAGSADLLAGTAGATAAATGGAKAL